MQPTTFLLSTVLGFLILFTIAIAAVHANAAATPGENGLTKLESPSENVQRCTFRTKQYLPGQVWHANTSSPHYCVLCTCTKTGELNCTNLECCGGTKNNSKGKDEEEEGEEDGSGGRGSGKNISIAMLEQHKKSVTMALAMTGLTKADSEGINACCETCGRRKSAVAASSSSGSDVATIHETTSSGDEKDRNSHYYDEETDDDPLVKANAEHVSCLHQGKIYRDQDSFASDLSGLPISSRAWDHCMHCICQGGMVLCTLKSCSDFDCGKPPDFSSSKSTVMEACCAKCSDDRDEHANKSKKAGEGGGGGGMMVGSKGSGQKPKSGERTGDMNDIADAQYLYTSIITTNGQEGGGGFSPASSSISISTSSLSSSSSSSSSRGATKHFILNHRLLPPSVKRSGCVSAGKFHFHGQTWHPIIGPFGSMECVLCKCLHSRIECSRLPCPSAIELQCSNLVKLEGHCCPTCFGSPTPYNGGPIQLCVSIYQDVTVYKSEEYYPSNDTQVTRLSFVRVKGNWNPKFQVEVHEWTLAEGKIFRFYTTYFTFNDFLNIQNKKTSVILGATTTRNLEKFTKREKKLHFRCKAHCNVRIQSLQLTLRLNEFVTRQKCLSTERSVKNSL